MHYVIVLVLSMIFCGATVFGKMEAPAEIKRSSTLFCSTQISFQDNQRFYESLKLLIARYGPEQVQEALDQCRGCVQYHIDPWSDVVINNDIVVAKILIATGWNRLSVDWSPAEWARFYGAEEIEELLNANEPKEISKHRTTKSLTGFSDIFANMSADY